MKALEIDISNFDREQLTEALTELIAFMLSPEAPIRYSVWNRLKSRMDHLVDLINHMKEVSNHHHYSVVDGILIEWYSTIRGQRYLEKCKIEHPDTEYISKEQIELILRK